MLQIILKISKSNSQYFSSFSSLPQHLHLSFQQIDTALELGVFFVFGSLDIIKTEIYHKVLTLKKTIFAILFEY